MMQCKKYVADVFLRRLRIASTDENVIDLS